MRRHDPDLRLAEAQRAHADAAQTHGWGSAEQLTSLDAMLAAERSAAAARGDQFAEPIETFPPPNPGAPLPHLVATDNRLSLVYLIHEPDPEWDGTYVRSKDPASDNAEPLAIVEFDAAAHRFGAPNEEILHGHPLWGNGLTGYGPHEVRNSRWITELQAISSVHRQYAAADWSAKHHYLFAFHDSTFEVVAASYRVTTARCSFRAALRSLIEEM